MIIGLSGYARSGKDSFYLLTKDIFSSLQKKTSKYAFADSLKSELDNLLKSNLGISAFTENKIEKGLIRPLLVTYGTDLRRKINPNCWIEKVESKLKTAIDDFEYIFISDVRYQNESDWIISRGGFNIYIERDGCGPANQEEEKNDEFLHKKCKYSFKWSDFTSMEKGEPSVMVGDFWKKINYGYERKRSREF